MRAAFIKKNYIMKRNIVFLFILLSFTLIQCKIVEEKKVVVKEISLPAEEVPFKASQLFARMEYLELQMPHGVFLKELVKVEEFENFLFIQDSHLHGLYIFNLNGQFHKIFSRQGRGPGEYISFNDFLINVEEKQLEVLDKTKRKIFVYDINTFEFIRSFAVPLTFVHKFVKQGDNYYFQTMGSRNTVNGRDTNADVIAYNYKTGETVPLFDHVAPENHNQFLEYSNIFYKSNADEIFVIRAWQQEMYKIDGLEVFPFFRIDAGNREVPEPILQGTFEEKVSFLRSNEAQNKIVGFRLIMHENNKTIIGYSIGGDTIPRYWLNFTNRQGKEIERGIKLINDFVAEPFPGVEIFSAMNGKVLSILYPTDLESSQSLAGLNITNPDNPVLLKFYFD
ncbi:MAG TPA: hypothetical protein DCM62_09590 [Bacteroidales bacterium]|nr:hypothetical protein [Bacteroidales bacterium]